jgi:hypothetical protein
MKPVEPGDVTADTVTITPDAMRGLELLRRHLDEDGHDWRSGTDVADVEAACAWIAAITARECTSDAQTIARLRAALAFLRRKVDGYDVVFEVAEEIAAGKVKP